MICKSAESKLEVSTCQTLWVLGLIAIGIVIGVVVGVVIASKYR